MSALYLYAVLGGDHPAHTDGLSGVGFAAPPVRIVRAGDVAAAVSDVAETLRPKRRDLNAHQQVVSALWQQGPVLPMRFGTLADGEEALRTDLAARANSCLEQLADLDGKAEFHVKAVEDEDAALRGVLSAEPALAERSRLVAQLSRDEQVAFGEAVAHRLQARQSEIGARVHATLAPLAERVVGGEPTAQAFFACSYLVTPERKDDFAGALNRATAAAGAGVELRVSGPLPPYSFV
ncbi:GvpL/GvpF family gas vesicle protein [Streptacidiphilus monticola]|uniref:GvpL/GvpF family gas vesicle protein n=1 Tax=Streptacidiphilus monticola TaxID=2161674 RepID=A0ABW1FZ09_9ACTN